MSVDEKVRNRLLSLKLEGERILGDTRRDGITTAVYVDRRAAQAWVTKTRHIVGRVCGSDSEHYKMLNQHQTIRYVDDMGEALGALEAARSDLDEGLFFHVRELIHAEVFDDFLEQGEELFAKGYAGPAAVVAGCVLEDALRQLHEKHIGKLGDRPKLDTMNSEIVKAGVYGKLQQKRVTALADIRNKAAHGKWSEFADRDVEDMLRDVRRFVTEHLG